MVLGGIVLFVLMVQPVVEGSATVHQTAPSASINTVDQQPNLDMSQLAQLDMDPVLMKFIRAVVTQLNEFKTELHEVKVDNVALKNTARVLDAEDKSVRAELAQVKTENVALQDRAQVVETENKAIHAELEQVRRDGDVLQIKTKSVAVELQRNIMEVQIQVTELQKQTKTNSVRLDHCEADTHPLIQEMERRRIQDTSTNVIGDASPVLHFARAVSFLHLSGRVDESNGGHRLLAEGQHGGTADCSSDEISRQLAIINDRCCDEPDEVCSGGKVQTCNAGCAAWIMPLWTSCRAQLKCDCVASLIS